MRRQNPTRVGLTKIIIRGIRDKNKIKHLQDVLKDREAVKEGNI